MLLAGKQEHLSWANQPGVLDMVNPPQFLNGRAIPEGDLAEALATNNRMLFPFHILRFPLALALFSSHASIGCL